MNKRKTKKISLEDLAGMVKIGFDAVDKKFDKVDMRFDKLENRFDKLENRFDKLENRFDVLEDKFDTLEDVVVRSHQRRIEKVEIVADKIKEALAIH